MPPTVRPVVGPRLGGSELGIASPDGNVLNLTKQL
jgi:hypothetical protein